MQATPATWKLLLESGWPGDAKLKVLCGGEALPRELAERLIPKCSALWNMYGPTETTIWSLVSQVESGEGQVSIGTPIANTQIYVLDRHLQPVPIGVTGELYLGGDGLARGYWKRPELTAEKFIEHPFEAGKRLYNTGDVARYRADGTFEFLGRVDHQVKIRGFRIELGEIEHVLSAHEAVAECAVVVHQKKSGEPYLAAHLVFEGGASATSEELQSHLREALPDYMVPPVFDVRDAMPLTPNGKIDRKALMASDVQRLGASEEHIPPRTPTEKLVAGIWGEILELDEVGRNDNFFDLGGHSLLLVQMRRRLQEATNKELSIAEVFQYPTVAQMGEFLSGGEERPSFEGVQQRVARRRSAVESDAIAIIGMAGRFPGARNLEEYWSNLRHGVESFTVFTDEELAASGIDRATYTDPNYVRTRGILDDIELFDAAFFQVPAREAEAMDPQHRLFLESAWEALENAGYDPARTPAAVGVYAGSLPNTYLYNNLNHSDIFESEDGFQIFLNNYGGGFLATRVAYKLNLKGAAVEVQTACSTSLVAVAQACQALHGHQCEMALAGGVALGVPQRVGYLYQEGLILSPDGHCRPFDEKGAGTLGGEGVGIVVLKRLQDALDDGDHIRAVIRGAATNNDGSNKVGFTAPSVEGQAEVIASALAQSSVDAESISYVEAHGTATPLGDPIEIAALTRAFRATTDKVGFCGVGSVKSNFGHADAAAGVAGLLKAVLSLEHREIPPSLHFEKPNPELRIEDSPFYVNAELKAWESDGPRRAGVSSFGFGGTNAHVVLEQAPDEPAPAPAPACNLLLLSAKSESALDAATANLAAHLRARPDASLADVAYTTQVSRSGLLRRRAIVCADVAGALEALDGKAPRRVSSGTQSAEDPPVVFMFPGQGAQHVQMGRELYDTQPVFAEHLDRCAELLQPHLGLDLRGVLYPDADGEEKATEQLTQTWLTQPAIFAIEYALSKLWMQWGVKPQAMIGHSIGEFVAATLAGVFSLEDALKLVAARGRLMQDLPEGDMMSVSLPEEKVRPFLNDTLSLAAVNGPASCVVSGPGAAVSRLQETLSAKDLPCRVLHTSHAFHSSMMDPIVAAFTELVEQANPQPARIPCVSTVTGKAIEAEDWADARYWARNLREPVRFFAGAAELLSEPDRVLLEVGPGQTLSVLVRQQGREAARRVVLSSMRHVREQVSDVECALAALGRLWIAGVDVDWRGLHQDAPRRRVPLPTYPFERQRYWVEPGAEARRRPAARAPAQKSSDLADWFFVPSWRRTAQTVWNPGEPLPDPGGCWLVLADENGLGHELADRLARDARVVLARPGEAFRGVGDGSFELRPDAREDYDALLGALREDGVVPNRILHLWSIVADDDPAAGLGTLDRSQARGFYGLMFLAQALGEQFPTEAIHLDVISNDLFDVFGREAVHPERATMLGPCRVMSLEYENLSCRNIDLQLLASTAQPEEVVDLLLGECAESPDDPVVAYRGVHRWVPTFDADRLPESPQAHPALREGGVYVVTGGLGGIGRVLTTYLAEKVHAKLVLVGRSAASQSTDHLAGAEVLALDGDVTDLEQMKAVAARARERFGAVHGVIHAAGLATGGLIAMRTAAGAAEVLDPKVRGTLILREVFGDDELDFFVLCSSINTIVPVVGAADYCGANAFLDALAHSADLGAGTPFISVNWDTWSEVGMAVDADLRAEHRAARAADLANGIASAEGVEAFARLLARPSPQIVVCPRGQDRLEPVGLETAEPGAAESETAPAEVAASTAAGRELHPRPDLSTDYVAPEGDIEEALAEIVQELLGIDRVGSHDGFFELGFDSLVAHRMVARIRERLEMDLTVRVILESPMVSELAKYLKVAQWAAAAGAMKDPPS